MHHLQPARRASEHGRRKAPADFCRLIDRAIEFGGRCFITDHRFAEGHPVEACHPRFAEFLRLKRHHDPDERSQSNWYRHYRTMFACRPHRLPGNGRVDRFLERSG